jgi:salicylate hydroxylase
VVQYPVRGGDWLNVVAIVHGDFNGDLHGWDHGANAADLQHAMGSTCQPLQELIAAVPDWRLWAFVRSASHARSLAAGSGIGGAPGRRPRTRCGLTLRKALAWRSRTPNNWGRSIVLERLPMGERLQHYANRRWQRCARVQARSIRNGEIFHSEGIVRWGRDAVLRVFGERVLDVPWLYAGPTMNKRALIKL